MAQQPRSAGRLDHASGRQPLQGHAYPVEYIHKNGVGYFEGCVIKYVSRWRKKNGVEDLKKARHFLDLLIEFEDAQRGGL